MGSNIFAALVLIVLGLFFLARNLGWIDSGLGSLLATWWPVVLVADAAVAHNHSGDALANFGQTVRKTDHVGVVMSVHINKSGR